jgi:hypothetical protein
MGRLSAIVAPKIAAYAHVILHKSMAVVVVKKV